MKAQAKILILLGSMAVGIFFQGQIQASSELSLLTNNIHDQKQDLAKLESQEHQVQTQLRRNTSLVAQLETQLEQLSQQLKKLDRVSISTAALRDSDQNPKPFSSPPLIAAQVQLLYQTTKSEPYLRTLQTQQRLRSKDLALFQIVVQKEVELFLKSSSSALRSLPSGEVHTVSEKQLQSRNSLHQQQETLERRLMTSQEDSLMQTRYLEQIQKQKEQIHEKLTDLQNQQQLGSRFQKTAGLVPFKRRLPLPVQGILIQSFGTKGKDPIALKNKFQGIVLETAPNAKVHSVALGKVVFAQEVKGYDQLVIVDHGKETVSVYGHLQALMVAPGKFVDQGMPLGDVAQDPVTSQYHTYFEIRYRGKAMNPAPWLKPNALPSP